MRETAAAATGCGLVMVAALVPFATTDLINVRQLGVGVAAAILLDVVVVRPVLMPAAEIVLGRYGWWPTAGRPSGAPSEGPRERRSVGKLRGRGPKLHLPHHRPRAAH
jgi:RND superfamily putative drug exporter